MKAQNRFSKSISNLDTLKELPDDKYPVKYKKFYIDRSIEDESYNVYTADEWESSGIQRVPEAEMPDIDSLVEFIESIEDVSDFDDEDLDYSVEEATSVGSIGQHKRCSIDLIPNVQQDVEELITESIDRVNTYVYVSEIRKAIENQNWKKEEYPLFEEHAEYLRDWLDSSGFTQSEDTGEDVYISPDDKFYVTITKDGKFVRFTDTDDVMEESPNITELEPNLPTKSPRVVHNEPEEDEEDGIENLEIPDDAPDEILLEVDVPDEEYDDEDDTTEIDHTSVRAKDTGEELTEDSKELDADQNQLLTDLANAVESTTPLEDMEYYVLKFVDVDLSLELAPILYASMNDEEEPEDVFEKLQKKISEYAANGASTDNDIE